MGGRYKAPCLKWQKQIKTNNNPCKPPLRAGTEAICTRAEARKSSFDSVLNHNKDYCCWEDGGEVRRGDAEGNKRNRGYLAGLSGALSAGVICRDVWNRADNKREKWAPQEQRLEAEQLTMHSLHAVFAVPHSKCSPSVRCDRCWFHMAHLTEKRPTGMSSEDKFLLSGCSGEWWQSWYSKGCYELSSGGKCCPAKPVTDQLEWVLVVKNGPHTLSWKIYSELNFDLKIKKIINFPRRKRLADSK